MLDTSHVDWGLLSTNHEFGFIKSSSKKNADVPTVGLADINTLEDCIPAVKRSVFDEEYWKPNWVGRERTLMNMDTENQPRPSMKKLL